MELLKRKVSDQDIIWLLKQVIDSFHSGVGEHKGIPLGNLTSQIFANIYLNELDQLVKHKLKIKCYLRYADDFIRLSSQKDYLINLVDKLDTYLTNQLNLSLHPKKISLRKLQWGIDFLGYIVLPYYKLPRAKTRKRIFKKLKEKIADENFNQSLQSYLGYLSHANAYKVQQELSNLAGFYIAAKSYPCRGWAEWTCRDFLSF